MFSDNAIAMAYASEVHHQRFIDVSVKRADEDGREWAQFYADNAANAAMLSGTRNATSPEGE